MATHPGCSGPPSRGYGVYHKDVGFPPGVLWPAGEFPLRYTHHAVSEARADGAWPLPRRVDLNSAQVVEARVEHGTGRVLILVLRTHLDRKRDVVRVVRTDEVPWVVLTVYVNRKGDSHPTLDRSRYDRPGMEVMR